MMSTHFPQILELCKQVHPKNLFPGTKGRKPDRFQSFGLHEIVNLMPLNSYLNGSRGQDKIYDPTGRIVKHVKNVEWNEGNLVQIQFNDRQGIFIVEVTSFRLCL